MCGIAGIVASDAERHRSAVDRMVAALRHRGPDGSGTHVFPNCALGHVRLSIVDLAGGGQPMLSRERRLGITFNGEIYGYRDLRRELTDYPFQTQSDTEVILALFERRGAAMMDRLPGMFAFAIWDERAQALFCARDRFGEKPFFYATAPDGAFLFASEIKAILASGLIEPEVDRDALTHYLQRLTVPVDRTIYRNIHTLPPGHSLKVEGGRWEVGGGRPQTADRRLQTAGSGGRLTVRRYWELPACDERISLADAVEEFRVRLRTAVAQQLVADVPVGAFLSGGLDSSTIVGLAARERQGLKTYSFGFDGDLSELPYARSVAELNRTEHVELNDDTSDLPDLLLKMAEVYDEPFADSSCIPTWKLCRQARQHGKVVLTGDGGDELLGGYSDWYQPLLAMQAAGAWSPLHDRLVRGAVGIGKRWGVPGAWRLQGPLALRDQWCAYGSIWRAHGAQNLYMGVPELRALGLEPSLEAPPAWALSGTVDDAMRLDLQDYMPADILVKIDRASMAHGLELRAPFLDVGFASFCAALPWRYKMASGKDKVVLRRAMGGDWPPGVRQRRKQGFGAPVQAWLARPAVHRLKEDLLGNRRSRVFGHISFEGAQVMAAEDSHRTWILLVLALWAERWAR